MENESYWKKKYVKEYQDKCDLEINFGKQKKEIIILKEQLSSVVGAYNELMWLNAEKKYGNKK